MSRHHKPTVILIIDTALDFGGSIVSTANLVRGLDRNRYRPIFVSGIDRELIEDKFQEAASTTQIYIRRKRFNYATMGPIGKFLGTFRSGLFKKAFVLFFYLLRHLINIPYTLSILIIAVRNKVDIIQINNGQDDESNLVGMLLHIPRIVYYRGYTRPGTIEKTLFAKGIRAYISVSSYVRDESVRDGRPADLSHVATPPAIPQPAADKEIEKVRKDFNILPSETVVAIFGRIIRWKGQSEFIDAMNIVFRKHPNCRALIVGDISDGNQLYLDELHKKVTTLNLGGKILFTGYRRDVDTLYGLADLVAHASIEPEPSGRVIFESMSHGTPVVASNLGGPKEFIEHGVDGFIVDPHDSEQFAAAIGSLIEDDRLRKEFGAKAKCKMERDFNSALYAEKIQKIYDKVLTA